VSPPRADAGGVHVAGSVPPSAWAKPDVQVSTDAAGGQVSAMMTEAAGRILHEIEAGVGTGAGRSLRLGSSSSFRNAKAVSEASDTTIGKDGRATLRGAMVIGPPPTPPSKDEVRERQPRRGDTVDTMATDVSNATTSSFANTLTSGLSSAMRYMLHGNEVLPLPSPPVPKGHHGLLSTDTAACIDERPHIKYDWTVGKRFKFSCMVYYARQFDVLRRRCGVDDVFVKSLSRSANWAADGGKSRSNFWKTLDDRFIIKTLVDAWNVADL
jgi:1-phosphatidylinositol-3-phosphate 5-kinase